jgi:hypothetical protein
MLCTYVEIEYVCYYVHNDWIDIVIVTTHC